jgi:hypothetical protein
MAAKSRSASPLCGKERLAGITKQANRYLRQLLVLSALAVAEYVQRNGTRGDHGWSSSWLDEQSRSRLSLAPTNGPDRCCRGGARVHHVPVLRAGHTCPGRLEPASAASLVRADWQRMRKTPAPSAASLRFNSRRGRRCEQRAANLGRRAAHPLD